MLELGGAFEAIDELKGRLVRSMVERTRRIESGEQQVVGVNMFTETADVTARRTGNILTVDPAVEAEMVADVRPGVPTRDDDAGAPRRLAALRRAAEPTATNIMDPSIDLARAGGTTGEWAGELRSCSASTARPTGCRRRGRPAPRRAGRGGRDG